MAAIQQETTILQKLDPRRPARQTQAALGLSVPQIKFLQNCDHQLGVALLHQTVEFKLNNFSGTAESLQTGLHCIHRRFFQRSNINSASKIALHLFGLAADNRFGFRSHAANHHRTARFDDPGFFTGNSRQRSTKIFFVIQRYIGYHTYYRIHNIGGIKTAAHTGFPHHIIASVLLKKQQTDHSKSFKISGMHIFFMHYLHSFFNLLRRRSKIFIADSTPVDADAFAS